MIYLIGSLRNPRIPEIAAAMREAGLDVFDDWYAAGPEADDYWRDYERNRGHNFQEALDGHAATAVFQFDHANLERADTAVLAMPAGKSAHLELGWCLGQGKRGYILLEDDPDRFDVMYKFADGVFYTIADLVEELMMPLGRRFPHTGVIDVDALNHVLKETMTDVVADYANVNVPLRDYFENNK